MNTRTTSIRRADSPRLPISRVDTFCLRARWFLSAKSRVFYGCFFWAKAVTTSHVIANRLLLRLGASSCSVPPPSYHVGFVAGSGNSWAAVDLSGLLAKSANRERWQAGFSDARRLRYGKRERGAA